LGATPEYGKAEYLRHFTAEIERVKAHFPNTKRAGQADGAESNWQFLTPHTQTQILDFYHASSDLGESLMQNIQRIKLPSKPGWKIAATN